MKGQRIKEILKADGITISDIARKLGYENGQRLHSALKSDDIKSGLLEEIARVTNRNIWYFYEEDGAAIASGHNTSVSGDSNQINALSEKFISLLEKKDKQLDRLIGIIEKYQTK